MQSLSRFAERLMTSNERLYELNLKRIGCDEPIDPMHADRFAFVLQDEHHVAINCLVAVSRRFSISRCASVVKLYLSCVLHSLQRLSVQLNPVTLITHK